MDKADQRVAAHQAATARRAAGLPIWEGRFEPKIDRNLPFEQIREQFATALHNSKWFKECGEEDGSLWWIWDEIKDADDMDHWALCLDALYDLADQDRIIVTPFKQND
jgi:hypothetical protein